jgi:poly(A) polymerase
MDDPHAARQRVVATVAPLAERFRAAGFRTYLVGGIVRDLLLGRSRRAPDIDLTTDATPDDVKRLLVDVVDALWTQGERFGTIGCRWHGETIEVTTHRAEAYDPASRKPEVQFSLDVRDDLSRRDFTVNAMAISLDDGTLVDPFDGQGDLDRRALRTPLSAELSFTDDPLRMLRAARFVAGYELTPVPELEQAIVRWRHRMAIVSRERVRDEIDKLLAVEHPDAGLDLLARTGLLAEVLPAIAALAGHRDEHSDDLLAHTMAVVAAASTRRVRWAALVHHLGAPAAESTLRDLTLGLDDVRAVVRSVALHGTVDGESTAGAPWSPPDGVDPRTVDPGDSDAGARRLALLAGEGLDEVLQLADANASSFAPQHRGPAVARVEAVAQRLHRLGAAGELDDLRPALDGVEVQRVLGLRPGPDVGTALRFLVDLRIERGRLDPAEAERVLRDWWDARSGDAG